MASKQGGDRPDLLTFYDALKENIVLNYTKMK